MGYFLNWGPQLCPHFILRKACFFRKARGLTLDCSQKVGWNLLRRPRWRHIRLVHFPLRCQESKQGLRRCCQDSQHSRSRRIHQRTQDCRQHRWQLVHSCPQAQIPQRPSWPSCQNPLCYLRWNLNSQAGPHPPTLLQHPFLRVFLPPC